MNISLNVIASLGASLVRPTRGAVAVGHRKAPRKMLEFYEGEYCPFCRYVRETLTALDLDAKIYPIPKRGSRFKQRLVDLGGKPKVPFLYDPNSRKGIYESEAIAAYLYDRYGLEGHRAPPRAISTSTLATTLRGKSGMFAVPSKAPARPLELYSFEACPYARLVRESLCELEIPYVLHNVGKGASRAEWLPPGYREIAMKDYVPGTRNREALTRARRTDGGAVSRGPQHQDGDVRGVADSGVSAPDVRRLIGNAPKEGSSWLTIQNS